MLIEKKTKSLVLYFSFVAALLTSSCGSSSGLLPQASGEIPSNDGITIESDGTTNLVATGSASSAVPDSATLVFQVTSNSTAYLPSLQNFYDWVLPPAVATEDCAPEISECPTLNDESQCKATANEDGSFVVTFPGSTGDTVEYWWYDPANSCSEADHYEDSVATETISVALSDPVGSYDAEGNALYLFGTDADGVTAVNLISIQEESDTYELSQATLDVTPALTGQPRQIKYFLDTDEVGHFFVHSSDTLFMGSVDSSGMLPENTTSFEDVSGDALVDLDMLDSDSAFVAPSASTCDYAFDPTSTYTRLYFSALYDSDVGEASLHIVDDFSLDFSGQTISARRASFASLTSTSNEFATSLMADTDTTLIITSVEYLRVSENDMIYMVLGYTVDATAAGETEYVVLSFPRDDCFETPYPEDFTYLGSSTGQLLYLFFDDATTPELKILFADEFEIYTIDLATMTASSNTISQSTLDPTVTFNSIVSFTKTRSDINTFVANVTTTDGEAVFRLYSIDTETLEVLSSADTDAILPEILGDTDLFLDTDSSFQIALDNGNGDDSTSSIKIFTPTFEE